MSSLTFLIEGEVNTQVTVTERDDGSLQFDVQVLNDTGQIGDIRALFFDIADDSLTGGLSVTGLDVTGSRTAEDGVYRVDSKDTTINGEVISEYGRFDVGIEFGTAGMSADDIQSTSFILSHDSQSLTLADIQLQEFGLRLTSVGEEGGAREDSLKLGGIAEVGPDAVDDDWLITAENLPLVGPNVLMNDTPGDILAVSAVNGDGGAVGTATAVTSEGGRTGSLTIYDDGSLVFDPLDGFLDLEDGQTDIVTATYQVSNGNGGYDTASLTITVLGVTGDGGDVPGLG